jgi:hypothetical protein
MFLSLVSTFTITSQPQWYEYEDITLSVGDWLCNSRRPFFVGHQHLDGRDR